MLMSLVLRALNISPNRQNERALGPIPLLCRPYSSHLGWAQMSGLLGWLNWPYCWTRSRPASVMGWPNLYATSLGQLAPRTISARGKAEASESSSPSRTPHFSDQNLPSWLHNPARKEGKKIPRRAAARVSGEEVEGGGRGHGARRERRREVEETECEARPGERPGGHADAQPHGAASPRPRRRRHPHHRRARRPLQLRRQHPPMGITLVLTLRSRRAKAPTLIRFCGSRRTRARFLQSRRPVEGSLFVVKRFRAHPSWWIWF